MGSLLLPWFCKPDARSGHLEGLKEVREVAWQTASGSCRIPGEMKEKQKQIKNIENSTKAVNIWMEKENMRQLQRLSLRQAQSDWSTQAPRAAMASVTAWPSCLRTGIHCLDPSASVLLSLYKKKTSVEDWPWLAARRPPSHSLIPPPPQGRRRK